MGDSTRIANLTKEFRQLPTREDQIARVVYYDVKNRMTAQPCYTTTIQFNNLDVGTPEELKGILEPRFTDWNVSVEPTKSGWFEPQKKNSFNIQMCMKPESNERGN